MFNFVHTTSLKCKLLEDRIHTLVTALNSAYKTIHDTEENSVSMCALDDCALLMIEILIIGILTVYVASSAKCSQDILFLTLSDQ